MYRLVPAFLALLVVGHGALAHDKEIEGAEVGGIEAQPEAVCDAGAPNDSGTLIGSMQKAISAHLNPLFKVHDVVVVDALPRTASQKVMRRHLRAQYEGGDDRK